MTHEEFIEKLNRLNPDRTFEITGRYISAKVKIEIKDEFGISLSYPESLYKAKGYFIKSAVDKDSYITNQFIKIHGDWYDYSKVQYKTTRTKITIGCPLHGDFEQVPNARLSGHGCPKCGREGKGKSTSDLIDELENKVKDKNYNIISTYKGSDKTILIENKYGICKTYAGNLLKGVIPGIETAVYPTLYWIQKAIEVHGHRYDYSNTHYINSSSYLKITCKKHGIFKQVANSHLTGAGCPKCAVEDNCKNNIVKYKKEFVEKSNIVHFFKYTYEFSIYLNAKTKLIITCPNHGNFKQTPDNHLSGKGCSKCAYEKTSNRNKENPVGWNYNKWQKAGQRSERFDSFKVYIIRCWNDEEEFYKIGRTFNSVDGRFKGSSALPYSHEILYIIASLYDARYMCELEHKLQDLNKDYKYLPKIFFNGMHECFSDVKNILKYIKNNKI